MNKNTTNVNNFCENWEQLLVYTSASMMKPLLALPSQKIASYLPSMTAWRHTVQLRFVLLFSGVVFFFFDSSVLSECCWQSIYTGVPGSASGSSHFLRCFAAIFGLLISEGSTLDAAGNTVLQIVMWNYVWLVLLDSLVIPECLSTRAFNRYMYLMGSLTLLATWGR